MRQMTSEQIHDFMRKRDIMPSYQRVEIYKYLYENTNHPSVDEIYSVLSLSIKTLSKTTVYNTLKLFIEKGIAKSLTIDSNETRYETRTDEHGHFQCLNCSDIFDFDVDLSLLNDKFSEDFQINQHHIYFKGYCKKEECSKKNLS